MKKIVRLTECDLHRIIKESANRILSEAHGGHGIYSQYDVNRIPDYMQDGSLEGQYGNNADALWTYNTPLNPEVVGGMRPDEVRYRANHSDNPDISKKSQNATSWDYFDSVKTGSQMNQHNKLERAYLDRRPNKPRTSYMTGNHDEDYDDYYPDTHERQPFRKELDKKWKDTKDIEKYTRQANSRPLHRKGSLNRAFD
jgi:hypothetical protein